MILRTAAMLCGAFLASQSSQATQRTWSGGGTDDNWSTVGNWASGLPVDGDDVLFGITDGLAITSTSTNNIVDASFTGVLRSLKFGQTNCLHRTEIAASKLRIESTAAVSPLFIGSGADDGGTAKNLTTIVGNAVEINNPNGDMIVRQGSATSGTKYSVLNMTGLDTFTANISRLLISYEDDSQNPNRRPGGTFLMARTNYITCNYPGFGYQIAHVVQQAGVAATNRLGQVNVFNARSMRFGGAKTGSTIVNFNTGYTDPTAKFRGIDGVSPQTAWYIADCATSGSSGGTTATVDLSAGIVDALIDTVYLGRGQAANNQYYVGGNGTLTFSGGLLDVNTFEVGYQVAAGSSAGRGVLNVNGTATLKVNNDLRLARNLGPVSGSTLVTNSVAFVTVNGGTVTVAGNIVDGGGISTLTITNGGTVNLKANGDLTAGNIGVSTLNLGQGTLTGFADLSVSNLNILAPATDFTLSEGQALYPVGKGRLGPVTAVGNLAFNRAKLFYELADPFSISDQINVTGNLSLTGLNPVDITPVGSFGAGEYTLMTYTGTLTGSAANLQAGGAIAGSRYSLAFSTVPGAVKLNVTGGPAGNLVWSGGNAGNTWDLKNTMNWNVGTDKFYNLDSVTFNDQGAATPAINLVGTLLPVSVTFNETKSYTFAGSGKISGSSSLNFNGTGKLTILTTNDFTGFLFINSGIVELGDGTTADGAIGSGDVYNYGAMVFNPAGHQIVQGAISGTGTMAKKGAGITEFAGVNTFMAALTNEAGTLKAGSASAFGDPTAGTTINEGTTLDLGGNSIGEPIVVSGTGVGGQGAIINSGPLGGALQSTVTITAPTTLGGSVSWSINPAVDGLQVNSNKLTKIGANSITIARGGAGVAETGLGEVDIQSGLLSFQGYVNVGDPAKAITIRSNATMEIANTGDSFSPKPITLEDGSCILSRIPNIALPQYCALNGVITLAGKGVFDMISGANVQVNAEITGPGSLVKGIGYHPSGVNSSGSGLLVLNASNSFTGILRIETGTLALTNEASVASAASIVMAGGTLDVSNRLDNTLTLGVGQSLTGNGTIVGLLVSPLGTTVAPGASVGALSVNGGVTLRGTTAMDISKFGPVTTADNIAAEAMDLGGTLNVTFSGDALAVGDTFTLFSAMSLANGFTTVNLPVIDGVVWTNKTAIDGTIAVLSAISEPTEAPKLEVAVSPNSISLSWPMTYTSYILQGQTNSLSVGLSTNWAPVPGVADNSVTIPIVPSNGSSFFRLIKP